VRTIGAGGGSIAFVPELTRALRVGPESAGAVPGPAAYLKGGEEPTVCDANVVLGYLPSDAQLGGSMAIDRDAAVKAVQKVADALEIDLMEAAEGIVRIANEAMFGALRLVSVEQGYDPRDFSLVGFGGAGPLHANALGLLLDSFPVIVPPGPGVLCAYGDATTQVQDEAARSYATMASSLTLAQLQEDLELLRERAAESLLKDGIPQTQHEVTYQADVRYAGQAFQISVDFTAEELAAQGVDLITGQFDAEHEKLFTFKLGDDHEIVMIRAVVKARAESLPPREQPANDTTLADCVVHETRIYYRGAWHDAQIYDRGLLHSALVVTGPAIITEMDSTTLVLPGYRARIDQIGNLLIEPAADKG
jgi:N-methylhydantoinase A